MHAVHPAFVLGLCPNGLGLIRALGARRVPVHGFGFRRTEPARSSRYARTELCPAPHADPEGLCELLLDRAASRDRPPVLLPTADEFVLFLSRFRDRLGERCLFALPPAEVVEGLLNKGWQYRRAAEAGIDIPATAYPGPDAGAGDPAGLAESTRFPAIVKPCYTHLWKEVVRGAKGFRVEGPGELAAVLARLARHRLEVVVQELVPGPVTAMYEVCCYLDAGGRSRGVFIKQKLRQYPCGMGLGSLVRSHRDPELAAAAVRLCAALGWRGPAEVEFKRDPRDGRYKLIELNARLTLQNALSTACGVDFADLQYRDLLGEPGGAPADYPADRRWAWLELDFEAFRRCRQEHGLGAAAWVRSLLGCRTFAVLSLRDPGPFLRVLGEIAGRRWRRLLRRGDPPG